MYLHSDFEGADFSVFYSYGCATTDPTRTSSSTSLFLFAGILPISFHCTRTFCSSAIRLILHLFCGLPALLRPNGNLYLTIRTRMFFSLTLILSRYREVFRMSLSAILRNTLFYHSRVFFSLLRCLRRTYHYKSNYWLVYFWLSLYTHRLLRRIVWFQHLGCLYCLLSDFISTSPYLKIYISGYLNFKLIKLLVYNILTGMLASSITFMTLDINCVIYNIFY